MGTAECNLKGRGAKFQRRIEFVRAVQGCIMSWKFLQPGKCISSDLGIDFLAVVFGNL